MVYDLTKKFDNMNDLKMLAPGTPLREGLENVLRAKTGALIVIGNSEEVMSIVDGGFNINSEFSPAYLYELAKMDGAIILSSDAKRILYANTQLIPDPMIPCFETGIRHRTAERVAKQTGEMVISISQRRNIITLYKGYSKYVLQETSKILAKANQAIQTLEKYKAVLDQAMINLSALEFEDLVTLYDVATVIQRIEMVLRIVNEVEKYIIELGNEGRLISMQLEELVGNIKEDEIWVFKDYNINENIDYEEFKKSLRNFTSEELLDLNNIVRLLGYFGSIHNLEYSVHPSGYRILNQIPRLPVHIIENLVQHFEKFQHILKASIEQLDEVEGIGEIRARYIRDGLRRRQEQVLLDRHI
ncbi:diadenylate cyclase [Alkalithermobacter thermoalcaliphilus JW-YL-7 = DSM 7308]|uniref:DNA integrity scanning protein DisA n=1 Tax=Alkalithermobacter thermoalcaliphilus JW-YL-7 = DSM 7308 TaxID=1121328 RepID=A0A150FMS1_CLOPD|nr:DNA integrity scanning protein disA [[Clostridium] paradoxum JW-YL-7 = DSM 7308]SHL26882.1 diadenylate cyclase [[Clostridium] paradoxum JW-YL-7 = DSM 7308]